MSMGIKQVTDEDRYVTKRTRYGEVVETVITNGAVTGTARYGECWRSFSVKIDPTLIDITEMERR